MNRIVIVQGDITEIEVDAIVNAANSSLLGGGGVDGAIHRKGGPQILEACQKIRNRQGQCKTGEAVITTAGDLPAKYVIHAVGPVWQGGEKGEEQLLRNTYRNSLKIAVENGVERIAFPNISTGIYGYPKTLAAEAVFSELEDFLKKDNRIKETYLVCYDDDNFGLYLKEYKKVADRNKLEEKNEGSSWLNNIMLL